jgi:hypothetical protein
MTPSTEIIALPAVKVPGKDAPVKNISSADLQKIGDKLGLLFTQYKSDRKIAELRWLRNQRQYLGIYDPEVEATMSPSRSKAYPRITRVKCISVLSRLMNLMFPGNERNWALNSSPSPDLNPIDVKGAIAKMQQEDQAAGIQSPVDMAYVMRAVKQISDERSKTLSDLIDDQLQELGGDQTSDYIALNRKVIQSGILYGIGVLTGPYAKKAKATTWSLVGGQPVPETKEIYKPVFEFLPIWDFYPDMSAKSFNAMDGHFIRVVMSRAQVRQLADRTDFFKPQVMSYLNKNTTGNYKPADHETMLRNMGVRTAVSEIKADTSKYEIIVWHGPMSGDYLRLAGVDVPDDKLADDIDAEIWVLDKTVIKAVMNPWVQMDVDVKTVHTFLFDEDDTSPVGSGLPNAVRDSQMGIAAAARMLMDNGSVVCGPNLEINRELLVMDQDPSAVSAYKVWTREGMGVDAQAPAVRNIQIESHIDELLKIIELWMKFADAETFVGPATGGDMEKAPSEPMRTAAGASMLRGDAALPFKDVVRNFDSFTQSIISSLVHFNRKFNPDLAPEGDYNVIARGATSLIAKELRGAQIDQLAATLRPAEEHHVDDRKFIEARFKSRDLDDLLVSEDEAKRKKAANDQAAASQQKQQEELSEANVRKLLSDSFKNVSAGQKNNAMADAATVKAALDVLEKGLLTDENPAAPGAGPADKGSNGGAAGGGSDGGEGVA